MTKDIEEQEELKEYTLITTVKAKLFQEGDEDGFVTRYYDDGDIDKDGVMHTSGLSGEHKVSVPYIYSNGVKILSHGFGTEYLVIQNGVFTLVKNVDFVSKYKLVL